MDSLSVRICLARTGDQIDDFILGSLHFTVGRAKQVFQRAASRIEELRGRGETREGLNRFLPGFVLGAGGNLALASQDLPKPDVGFKNYNVIHSQNVLR